MTAEQLHSMDITTPAIEHVFASVLERMERSEKRPKEIEHYTPECYN